MKRTPVFFIGHGSPLNAIAANAFTESLGRMRKLCANPKAILCISAHWITEGSWVTAMEKPRTIHDFYGFPQALFDIQYPAPGSPAIADLVCKIAANPQIRKDPGTWGIDHGTWSVLRHIYPEAEVPVLQLSLDMEQPPAYHFQLGKRIRDLRNEGVLIVGSGNIVHNLREIKREMDAEPYDWAREFDAWAKEKIIARDFDSLTNEFGQSQAGRSSVPTNEHYYPLLYALGAADAQDQLFFEFEGIQNASISMRTFSFRAE